MIKTSHRPVFGEWLSKSADAAGHTRKSLADLLRRTPALISDWFNGNVPQQMTVEDLVLISMALDKSAVEVMTYYLVGSTVENTAYATLNPARKWYTPNERYGIFRERASTNASGNGYTPTAH